MESTRLAYAYLDEANSLPSGPGYFVIAILVTYRPRALQKIIRKARARMKRSELKRRRGLRELKFHNASVQVRRRVLDALGGKEVDVFLAVVRLDAGVPDTPKNYAQVVELALRDCLERHKKVLLTVDLHFNVKERREEFNEYLMGQVERPVSIVHQDSRKDSLLQLVDFVAGAVYQKYANGNSEYWDLFAERVVAERFVEWPIKNDGGEPGGRFT